MIVSLYEVGEGKMKTIKINETQSMLSKVSEITIYCQTLGKLQKLLSASVIQLASLFLKSKFSVIKVFC